MTWMNISRLSKSVHLIPKRLATLPCEILIFKSWQ